MSKMLYRVIFDVVSTTHMEKIYKYYERVASEDSYRVCSDTVAQNNWY